MCETQAGRGALRSDHPLALGAVGATGTSAANRLARDADLVIGVGTRWSDFTTASKSAFQDPGVRFININVAARRRGETQCPGPRGRRARSRSRRCAPRWPGTASRSAGSPARADEALACARRRGRLVSPSGEGAARPLAQASVIGAVNDAAGERGVVVCAAGSLPGDLHKLWRARDPDGKGYHVEYGYSCMGYEIPGGIGVRLAAPDREVFVMVGDGSYMMGPTELATAVAEQIHIVVVLLDNHGFASIGALSRSLGSAGFGTIYRRSDTAAWPSTRPTDPGRRPRARRCPSTSRKTPRASGRPSCAPATWTSFAVRWRGRATSAAPS